TNTGPSSVGNAEVTDSVPANLTATTPSGCTQGGGVITCEIGTLLPGQTASRTVTATVSSTAPAGPVTNTACVHATTGETDPNTADNCAQATTVVTRQANLAITKTSDVLTATAGTSVTY